MSNKNYTKKKKSASGKKKLSEKEIRIRKIRRFLKEYGWLITFIIVFAVLLLIINLDRFSCESSCQNDDGKEPVSTASDTVKRNPSATDEYIEKIEPLDTFAYTAPASVDPSFVPADDSSLAAISTNQFSVPDVGEDIVVLSTKYGDLKIQLFPEQCPIACANFKQLVSQNAFDGTTVYGVTSGAFTYFGDPAGMKSVWGDKFAEERDRGLYAFTGALFCHYDESVGGYRFGIIHSDNLLYAQMFGQEDLMNSYGYSEPVSKFYTQIGGFPALDAHMDNYVRTNDMLSIPYITIFGQVYSGHKILNALGKVSIGENNLPVDSITVSAYLANVTWNNSDAITAQ